MEVAPFFFDFHDLRTFFAIYILSRFTHFFRIFFFAKIAFTATSHVFCMYDHNQKDFLKCPDNARPPEPRIQNTRRTLGRLQLHELQTCIESQVQSFIIQHQHCDLCRRHISTYAYPNQHHLQESFVQRTIKQSIWLRSRHS